MCNLYLFPSLLLPQSHLFIRCGCAVDTLMIGCSYALRKRPVCNILIILSVSQQRLSATLHLPLG